MKDIITSCSEYPCQYSSTCQQVSNVNSPGYRCICPDSLTGDRCQYTNQCQQQPCHNQGTCIPLGPQKSFNCACRQGFGNYDCSTSIVFYYYISKSMFEIFFKKFWVYHAMQVYV